MEVKISTFGTDQFLLGGGRVLITLDVDQRFGHAQGGGELLLGELPARARDAGGELALIGVLPLEVRGVAVGHILRVEARGVGAG